MTQNTLSPEERHKATIDVALEDLDAAAQPAKCEVFTSCGAHAADLRDAIRHLTARAEKAEQHVKAIRETIHQACYLLRIEARANEMSANIMRDPVRTGGWSGAENTARAFDRHGLKLAGIRTALLAALGSVTEGEK